MRQKKRKSKLTNLSTGLNPSSSQDLLHSDKSTYFYKKSFIILSAFALLGLGNPIMNYTHNVYAASPVVEPETDGIPVTIGAASDFSISLSLDNSSSSTVSKSTNLDAGVVGYIETNIKVTSKSAKSYSLYLQPASGSTSSLVGKDYKQSIPSMSGSASSPSNNTWGYSLGNTDTANSNLTYSAIPNGSSAIKTVSSPDDGDDTYKLVFAAKIDDTKPADHYQTQMLLSVAASPAEVTIETPPYAGITYMQDMTSTLCAKIPLAGDSDGYNQYQLADKRDNKVYYIARLSDGNCWMTPLEMK